MLKTRHSLAMCALVGGLLVSVPAIAAPAAAQQAAPQVGLVDMVRLSREANSYKDAEQELSTLWQRLNQNLQEVMQFTYLTPEETKSFIEILDAKELSAAQKTRYTQLKATANDREREYNQLAAVKEPNEEQKKRLNELTQMRSARRQSMEEMKNKYEEDFKQKEASLGDKQAKLIEQTCQSVAQDQKLIMVLPKNIVLFGGKDVTDEVLKRMNKAK